MNRRSRIATQLVVGTALLVVGAPLLVGQLTGIAQAPSAAPSGAAQGPSPMLSGSAPGPSRPPSGSATSVVPAGGEPLGVPYGEWASRWWTWYTGIPTAGDPGSVDNCQAGQGGDVFFVPQTYFGNTFETDCEVDASQWILASAGGTVQTNADGETDEELQANVEGNRQLLANPSVVIDGSEVPGIDGYWVVSPAFDLEAIEDNMLGAEPGADVRAVTGGWFVMIPPLEPGRHTIVVESDVDDPSDGQGPTTARLTARIGVAPGSRSPGVARSARPTCDGAPAGTIWTVAGSSAPGDDDQPGYESAGDGGPAVEATLNNPVDVILDGEGNLYIADSAAHGEADGPGRVRKVDPAGTISTFVGPPTGPDQREVTEANDVLLMAPWALALDDAGNLYVNAGRNAVIRVDPSGHAESVAGTGVAGFSGDGGPATEARLDFVVGLALDGDGNLYIADLGNNRIRMVDPAGVITTFAGNGAPEASGDGGLAKDAGMTVGNMVIDEAGTLYFGDGDNLRVRAITRAGVIMTVAGNGEGGYGGDGRPATETPIGIAGIGALDATGRLYLTSEESRILRIDADGTLTTVAGNGRIELSDEGIPAVDASLHATGIALDRDGALYVADFENARIRVVCP